MSAMSVILLNLKGVSPSKAQACTVTIFRDRWTRPQIDVRVGGKTERLLDGEGKRPRIVAQAGMGRTSGAVHGSRTRKGRRIKPVQDGDEVHSRGEEAESTAGTAAAGRTAYGDNVDFIEELKVESENEDTVLDQDQSNAFEVVYGLRSSQDIENKSYSDFHVTANFEVMNRDEDDIAGIKNDHEALGSNRKTIRWAESTGALEFDEPKKVMSKTPLMQRRNSRGRKKKQPSTTSKNSITGPIYLEEVAPVAVKKINIDPHVFLREKVHNSQNLKPSSSGRKIGPGVLLGEAGWVDFSAEGIKSENFGEAGHLVGAGAVIKDEKTSRLRSIIKGSNLATDNLLVRSTVNEAERPASIVVSLCLPSTNMDRPERVPEKMKVNVPTYDMNHSNGHIRMKHNSLNDFGLDVHPNSTSGIESPTGGALQLLKPRRLVEGDSHTKPIQQKPEQETLASRSKVLMATTDSTTSSVTAASTIVSVPLKVLSDLPTNAVKELPKKVAEVFPAKGTKLTVDAVKKLPQKVAELPAIAVLTTTQVLKTQVVEPIVEGLPDKVVEQVSQAVEQVVDLQLQVADSLSSVAEQVAQIGQTLVDQVTEALPESVVEQASATASQVTSSAVQVTESVTSKAVEVTEVLSSTVNQVSENVTTKAVQVTESVTSTAAQVSSKIVEFLSIDNEDSDSEDEFEAFKTSDSPEFKGMRGLENFQVKQEDYGVLAVIYDFYTYMLKKPLPQFAVGMLAAPILLSMIFTLLYLPEFRGLALDETARNFLDSGGVQGIEVSKVGLELSPLTVFQVFMFSLSLSTGLQPELAPLSPYTLVVANVNALVAQLIFVFLSGAVFARLSQPSQPVRCSTVALVAPSLAQRRRRTDPSAAKVFMARYVLAGPQPCELVDVKVDLTYKYNTVTRSGTFFRATQSLKIMYHGATQVQPEIAYLNHGMLVRHIIDDTSPLYRRTPEMLHKEDAIFVLCVVGLERSSMQSVFHVQHYCVCDDHVKWDAEFEDMLLINKKNRRIMDHTKLSSWRRV